MRLLIAGINYTPETTGIGPYTAGLAEHLAGRGHDVVVSTTFPHYPHWRWQPGTGRWRRTDRVDGVEVRRMRVVLPRRARAGWRIAYDTSYAATVLATSAMMRRPDLVLCVTPPIQAALTAAALARRWRVPLVLLVKDLPLEAALSVGMMRGGRAYRLGEWLERRAYARADLIVAITEQFRRSLSRQGVPARKVVVIPDWADVERIRPRSPDPDMRELLGSPDGEFVVLHAGTMGEKQGLGSAVRAAGIAGREAPIRLALVGEGPQRPLLEDMVEQGAFGNVRLLPLQPAAAFPRMLAAADALLLNQRADVLDSVAPSKLLAYMAAGRPIVAAANPDSVAARLVIEAGCGVIVPPEDPEALAQAMCGLTRDAERRRELGMSGRRFVEERFERTAILGRWESVLTVARRTGRAGAVIEEEPAQPEVQRSVDDDVETAVGRFQVVVKHRIRKLMPRRARPHRIWAGPLRGRRLVTSWHDYPAAILGYTERSLLRWLQGKVTAGETWIDVGAHYGYTALALSQLVGPRGRVFAFEPVLTTAGCLNRTRALNDLSQLTVVPLALAADRRLQPVEVPLVRGMADHVAGADAHATDRLLAVAFDEIWPGIARGETRIDGVKIDVQGMELDVLAGMRQALSASRPLLVLELHHGVDRSVLLQLLSTVGYVRSAESIEPLSSRDGTGYLDNHSYCFRPE